MKQRKSEWLYDAFGRKFKSFEFTWDASTKAWNQTSEKRRVFDGLDVVQERDASNVVTAQLVRDGNIGGILSRTTFSGTTSQAMFPGYDGQGNVIQLTSSTGTNLGGYVYDAWGNLLETTPPHDGALEENPYRFSTKELHAASGLYDFGFRFYSAGTGRWINRDPIRESGGLNLYAMVGNDPVNSVDPYGLNPYDPTNSFSYYRPWTDDMSSYDDPSRVGSTVDDYARAAALGSVSRVGSRSAQVGGNGSGYRLPNIFVRPRSIFSSPITRGFLNWCRQNFGANNGKSKTPTQRQKGQRMKVSSTGRERLDQLDGITAAQAAHRRNGRPDKIANTRKSQDNFKNHNKRLKTPQEFIDDYED